MTEYSELPTLKKRLKRAAIDAWMKDEDYEIDGDGQYEYVGSGRIGFWVTRPDENGEGGGDWTTSALGLDSLYGGGDKDAYFTSSFADIRSGIDHTLEPWEDLPDPSHFDDLVRDMRAAKNDLAVTAAAGGVITGPGLLGGSLDLIRENSDAMAGGIITAFKTRFLLQLGATIGGYNAVTVILGGALESEKKLWEDARQTVADAVVNATAALNAYAHDSDHDWTLDLKVAGAVVSGVTAFVSGTAPILVGAGSAVSLLTALSEESEEQAAEPASHDYEGLRDALSTSLRDLNDAIKNEEQGLKDNLQTNLQTVANAPGFDLEHPLVGVADDSDLHLEGNPAVILDHTLVGEITGTAMPDIANVLVSARTHLSAANRSLPWVRDSRVGISARGCYPTWADLLWVTEHLLRDLDWEVRNGAKTLELAVADMGQVDTDAQDALELHAAALVGGSGWEDYDHHLHPGDD